MYCQRGEAGGGAGGKAVSWDERSHACDHVRRVAAVREEQRHLSEAGGVGRSELDCNAGRTETGQDKLRTGEDAKDTRSHRRSTIGEGSAAEVGQSEIRPSIRTPRHKAKIERMRR